MSWLLRKKPPTILPSPKMLSTVVVMETALPSLSTITKWVVPPGSGCGRARGRRRPWACRDAGGGPALFGRDQLGAGVEVVGRQQALHRHVHEVRVAVVAVAVGVHQPARLAEQVPALGVVPVLVDVGALQDAQALQHRRPAGRRGRRADGVFAVGAADGGRGLGLVARQVLQRHGAGVGALHAAWRRSPRRSGLPGSPWGPARRSCAGWPA